MYLARFSYDVLPINRQRAVDFIRREVDAARKNGLNARLLVPLTRGPGQGASLQFEIELKGLRSARPVPQPRGRLDRGNRQLDARLQRGADAAALRRNSALRELTGTRHPWTAGLPDASAGAPHW